MHRHTSKGILHGTIRYSIRVITHTTIQCRIHGTAHTHTHTHTHEGYTMNNQLEEWTINHGEWEEPTLEHTQHWMGWIELWDNGRLDNLADDSYDEDYDDE